MLWSPGAWTGITLGLVVGVVLWTLTEYWVHRSVMHAPGRSNAFAVEHLDHHRRPLRTEQLRFDRNLWWKVGGGTLTFALVAPLAGWWCAAAAAATFAASYAVYTDVHHRIHHQEPTGWYRRWARRQHYAHHFGGPRTNYGVTTSIWDRVFRTAAANPRVSRPGRPRARG
jgi:sterol desaturase/sphingolipid hydroxylase (fatty acid hydroxylase superfamily)